MDKYINKETVVENEIYIVFKDLVICPLCSNILIEPYMCTQCHNTYCKKCCDNWSKTNNKCQKGCELANYQKNIEKNNILSKLKFKCNNCGEEILYEKVQNHMDECETTINTRKKRLKKLKKEEIANITKNTNLKIIRINCKKKKISKINIY